MKTSVQYLDKTDMKILKLLQQDGSITNLQLSSNIELSPAPTLERVKKLESYGFIKSYHAIVDEEKLNINIKAYMLVSMVHHKNTTLTDFVERIKDIHEIVECNHVTGAFDFMLKVMVKDIHAYQDLILNKLSLIEDISQMQTLIILSSVKQSRVIPIDYENEEITKAIH